MIEASSTRTKCNHLLLDALNGNNCGRPPVWLMRQAGRYMPQYRALREKYSFMEMISQPELAAEITFQPIDELGVDAAILFSDILVIVEAFGRGLHFDDGVGPIIDRPIQTIADIDNLPIPQANESLDYVAEALRLLRKDLDVPLLGFSGAPFTLASYMIEGRTSKDHKKTKKWMFADPTSFHRLLNRITDLIVDYLKMQISAGAQALQIFDSWAGVLAQEQFREFSLAYLKKIISQLPSHIPVIVFCRGASVFAEQLSTCGARGLSIDWNGDLSIIRQTLPKGIVLQGNLDPDVLLAPASVVEKEVLALLNSMKGDPAYIFNLGHGVLPGTPVENVRLLVDLVKNA